MFSHFHLTTRRETTELKTGHRCSTLYAFHIRIPGITGLMQTLSDFYYSKSHLTCYTVYVHTQGQHYYISFYGRMLIFYFSV